MVAEPSQAAFTGSSEAGVPMPPGPCIPKPRCKYRLRFGKGGDLRLVSHHDLMHVMERMLRRAQIPIAHTQGFHPQPRMIFALSLALGIAGTNEVLELELTESLDPENLHARLANQAPPGLEIRSVRCLEGKSSSLVRRAFYRLPLQFVEDSIQADGASQELDSFALLPQRCLDLLDQAHLWVQRSRPQPRKLDIRPYLSELRVQDGTLEMAVWVTPTGTARPEEFACLLGLEPWLDAGAFFERSDLEMMDEVSAPVPELNPNPEQVPTDEDDVPPQKPESAQATKPVARPTALISGPLSFDS